MLKSILCVILFVSALFGQGVFPPASGSGGSGTVTSVATGCGTSGGTITTTGTIIASEVVRAVTGTSDTTLNTDCGKLVTFTNGSAIAVTLPQANGSMFVSGWFVKFQNRGAGTITITPTTSTIDGAASLTLLTSDGVEIHSDGTNYFTVRGRLRTILVAEVPTLNQNTTGNADTATALAANPTNCSAGNYPLGIDASGDVENCTAAGGGSPGAPALGVQYNDGSGGFVASSDFVFYPSTTAPTAPVLAVVGTPDVITYGYELAFRTPTGTSAASVEATIATGNPILDGTNYVTVTAPACTSSPNTTVDVWLTTTDGGSNVPTTGYLANIACGATYNHQGQDGNGSTPPSVDTTPGLYTNVPFVHGAVLTPSAATYTNPAGFVSSMSGTFWDDANRILQTTDANSNVVFELVNNPAGVNVGGDPFYLLLNKSALSTPAAPPDVSSGNGTFGASVFFAGFRGGNSTDATSGILGGDGGGVTAHGGQGGTDNSVVGDGTGGTGGGIRNFGGNGGPGPSGGGVVNSIGGNGGDQIYYSGAGGDASSATSATGGNGGELDYRSGQGGAATGAGINVGGHAPNAQLSGGNGGAASGGTSNTGGDGGNVSLRPGTGGSGSTANGANGKVVFNNVAANTSFYWSLDALASDYTVILPSNQGTGALTNDGAGALSWSAGSAGQATCWKTNGQLSYCESVVGVAGACTCH